MTQHRVLVVGTGSIGERHTRCFLQTGRARVGIVEPTPHLRDTVAGRYALDGAYASLDEAIAHGPWDTAVICTPAPTHVRLARQCLLSAIPTLIEKPLALASNEAAGLLELAAPDLPIGVAYVYRAHPAIAAMRKKLISGVFGQPLEVVAVQGQHLPTHRPAYASTYMMRHETGGGAIQDALTHLFNAAEWLVGPITRIAVDASHKALPGTDVEDTVHALARHGEVMASYALNQYQAPDETTLTVVCEQGTMRYGVDGQGWRWQTDPRGEWTVCPTTFASRDTWFELQANAWLDTVELRQAPLCTLQEGLQTLSVNEAALTSMRSNARWVSTQAPTTTPGLGPLLDIAPHTPKRSAAQDH